MNQKLFIIIPLFIIGCWLSIHSCKKSGTNPAERDYVMPDKNVVFDSDTVSVHDIQGLFELKCGSWDGCHSAIEPAKDLDLTASCGMIVDHQIEGGGFLIISGDADASILYRRLLPGNGIGEQMPRGGPYLTDNQINAVIIWIDTDCPCDERDLED